jgi:hypothetical protein
MLSDTELKEYSILLNNKAKKLNKIDYSNYYIFELQT